MTMRSALHIGIAALVTLSACPAMANHTRSDSRVERRVIIIDGQAANDDAVYRSAADRAPVESEYRRHTVRRDEPQRNDGLTEDEARMDWEQRDAQWHYQDGEWHRRDAEWHETRGDRGPRRVHATGRNHDAGRHHAEDRRAVRTRYSDAELERMCRRDDGVGGAIIGGAVGGIIGNRVAGRGNRTAGTLIGGGVGAVVGAAIDQSEDRSACNAYWERNNARSHGGYVDGYDRGGHASAAYGYGGGYVMSAPTTIVIPGAPIIIEETETYYETVTVARPRARVAPRRVARPAVRPRPRCVCR